VGIALEERAVGEDHAVEVPGEDALERRAG
jgi:hypothetical protein